MAEIVFQAPAHYGPVRRFLRPLTEQARRAAVSESTMWRWARAGLPTCRIGKDTHAHDLAVDRYIAARAAGEAYVRPTAKELLEYSVQLAAAETSAPVDAAA